MEKTKEYEQFKMLNFNRKGLDRIHINKLKDSITKNGYMGSPILVNEDFEIFDGQHRFVALKEMGMEIPYEVIDAKYDSIIDLNITQKKWGLDDYINYYCVKDSNENYRRLKRLCKEIGCGATNILTMAYKRCIDGDIRRSIKDGTLKFKLDDELRVNTFNKNFEVVVKSLKTKPSTRMCAAMADLSTRKNFNWHTMMSKAQKYPTLYYNCRTQEEFIVMLKNIYNFNTRKEEQRI